MGFSYRTLKTALLVTFFSSAALMDYKQPKLIKTTGLVTVYRALSGTNLVELQEDPDGELGAENAAEDHLVQRLREPHAEGGPPVHLEGGRHTYLIPFLPLYQRFRVFFF
jgi:hypothetical protein